MQPTASKAHLLLECAYPFAPERVPEHETSEAAEYGTAFHFALAARITGQEYEADQALRAHVEKSWEVLHKWLLDNGYLANGDTVLVERSLALNVFNNTAREISPPDAA